MEAIILAGGLGTRLREVLYDTPKPMAPIAGRPFLEILLRILAQKNFFRVVISLGYMAEKISSYFGDSFSGMELAYVVEKQPLGTGGGTRLAMVECYEDHVFVLNGDTFLDLEVDLVERQLRLEGKPIIVGREVSDTARYGRLVTKNGLVTGFTEKGISGKGVINAGCYVFFRDQLNSFPVYSKFSLEDDYLPRAVAAGSFGLFMTKGNFIDIGVPEDYHRAQAELVHLAQ